MLCFKAETKRFYVHFGFRGSSISKEKGILFYLLFLLFWSSHILSACAGARTCARVCVYVCVCVCVRARAFKTKPRLNARGSNLHTPRFCSAFWSRIIIGLTTISHSHQPSLLRSTSRHISFRLNRRNMAHVWATKLWVSDCDLLGNKARFCVLFANFDTPLRVRMLRIESR